MRLGLPHLVDPRLLPLVDASRDFYAQRPPGRGPRDEAELRALRAGRTTSATAGVVTEVARVDGHEVPLRLHLPSGPATGVVLDLHGGGFYLGAGPADDARSRALVDALGVVAVGVDHRLAPEDPWPAAPDDCATAARWLVGHAAERFGTTRLAVAGFSAGATLAVTTLLRLRERGVDAFAGAVLQFGTYDLSGRTPASRLITDEYFLQAYAGTAADRTHPDLSPVYADLADLAGLPPVLMVVGEEDVLLHDNLAMAARLAGAGVDVDLRVYPASPHAFTGHPTPMARAALDDIEGWLGERLAPAE